jgi:hypothetical protein
MIGRYIAKRDNPWELLAIASLFFFPGIGLLVQHETVRFRQPRARYFPAAITEFSVGQAHFFGWCAVSVAALFVLLYVYARLAAAKKEKAPPPHFLDFE